MSPIRSLALAGALLAAGCAQRTPAPPLATKPTVGQEVAAVAGNKIEISFAPNSAKLSPDAGRQLDLAARLFRDVGPAVMYAAGHSDAAGNEYDNILLSAQRARAVKQGLIDRGIPSDRVFIQALGVSEPVSRAEPLAPTNRRVVVQWSIL